MLQEMSMAASDRLWAEALNHTCDMSNMYVTSSLKGGTSPYEKWYGRNPSLQHLQPFGTVSYAQKGKRAQKLAPRGEQCVMLDIAHNYPRDTVKVLVVQTEQMLNRKNVSWHPEINPGGPISIAPAGNNNTAEPVGVRGNTTEAHTPTQLAQEAEEESESSEPPRSPGPQHSEQMETRIEESSDQTSEPMVEPAMIPAAVRNLANYFTGVLASAIHERTRSSGGVDSRARSGEIDGGPSAFSGVYIGKDGQIEKYKCRFVTQRFRQVKGLHCYESFSPTLTSSSMRAVLTTATVKNWGLRPIDVEQAYLQANIVEEIYIELPEE
ncbi:unnamed protein product [Ascophyllum nodosum]